MKKILGYILLSFFGCILLPKSSEAQTKPYGSARTNALVLNVGQYLINEINVGYEHFYTEKRSYELHAGLIYRNDVLREQADKWINSEYFYERGFTFGMLLKNYKKVGDKEGRKNYYAFGFNYQYLHFNNEWFVTDKKIEVTNIGPEDVIADEEIFRHRFRHRLGLQTTLGSIFPIGNGLDIELYYGIGLRAIMSNRLDVERGVTIDGERHVLETLNFSEDKFYLRPTIHAGLKFKIGW